MLSLGSSAAGQEAPQLDERLDLGTSRLDQSGNGRIYALSSDGNIAAGWARNDDPANHAAVWSGANWQTRTDLGTLKTNNSGTSFAFALSSDGTIVGGQSHNSLNVYRATIWFGSNWQTQIDLGTLKTDNSGTSWIRALSSNGNIAAGQSTNDNNNFRATLWSGINWQTKTDLGTLRGDNTGNSRAEALSANGSIAAGWAVDNSGQRRAIIWSGTNWQNKQDLGTLRANNTGNSTVESLSGNGLIAGGFSQNDSSETRATVWYGSNWQTKTDLGTLKGDNSGNSSINAVSADGASLAGEASDDANQTRAVYWSGTNWQNIIDLGTLKADNSGQSAAFALSENTLIVGGQAENDNGELRPTVWRLSNPDPATPEQPEVVAAVDTLNTARSLEKLSLGTLSVMELQRRRLHTLQKGCNLSGSGKNCFGIEGDYQSSGGNREAASSIYLGRAFTSTLAAGIGFSNSFATGLPPGFDVADINLGGGIWAQWTSPENESGFWYLRGAASANWTELERTRTGFSNIEKGSGSAPLVGWSASAEIGRAQRLSPQYQLTYYGGLRYTGARLGGYTETVPGFPYSYESTNSSLLTALLGASFGVDLTKTVNWSTNVEFEQDLVQNTPQVVAKATALGNAIISGDLAHSRVNASTSLSYELSEAVSFEVTPYGGYSTDQDVFLGVGLRLNASF